VTQPLASADHDGIRVLTLNRPDARNALSRGLVEALFDALCAADDDDGASVVVPTGADPAFCAGVDLKEAARSGRDYFAVYESHNCVARVGEMRTPVIGAVNGAAFTAVWKSRSVATFSSPPSAPSSATPMRTWASCPAGA
jgi:enoyl-CoA hydratase